MKTKECKHKNHEGERFLYLKHFGNLKRSNDGLHSYCKTCCVRDTKKYVDKNKEKVAQCKHKYYLQNKEKYVSPSCGPEREEYLQRRKEYYVNNQESIKAYRKQYNEKNKDNRKLYSKKYYQENKDRIKRYREQNPDKHKGNYSKLLERCARRRAKNKNATPKWYEQEKQQIIEMYEEARRLTRETGIQYHVDHEIPLNHPKVCGLHCLANLQILTADENIRKNNTFNG